MKSMLVTRLCIDGGLYRPGTLVLGDVELRSARLDAGSERAALVQSLGENQESAPIEICARLTTIVTEDTAEACDREATIRCEQALDLIDADSPGLSQFALLESGYTRELPSGPIVARKPQERLHRPSTMFAVTNESYPRQEFVEWLPNQAETELIRRYRRAIHWSRRARWEHDMQLATLFRWFSIEAACKIDEDTNVAPIVCSVLGFPQGKIAKFFSPHGIPQLRRHPTYSAWNKEVAKRLDDLSRWRNDSVHSGFRPWDIDVSTLRQFHFLAIVGAARMLGRLRDGILAGLTDVTQFHEYLPILICDQENLVNDVHGTIYALEHPDR